MGQPVSRLGDVTTGHGGFPPQNTITSSPDVFVNGIAVSRQSDGVSVHCCGNPCHGGSISGGSSTVYVNGLPLARIGDAISCGGAMSAGSSNVFSG